MIVRLLVAGSVLLLVLALVARELERRWLEPLVIPEEGYVLRIAAGDSLRTVTLELEQQGIYSHPYLLRAFGRWTGLDQQIKRGEYLLQPGLGAQSLLRLLVTGKVVQYQVTLPEGITLRQALVLLQQAEALEHTLSGVDDPDLGELVGAYANPEGLFLPETYRYERGDTDLDILARAHRALIGQLEQAWQQRAPNLPYETPYEAVIMASIIERETGVPEERPEIAGVFVRRLQRGMRLQTDPTIIYGLGESFDGNLRRQHLQDESNPYNTYRHHGLPPTPIALPGRAAIEAALNPAEGETLYFVARGDGSHVFSATLEQHQQAVRKYQLQRRADYRSSPGDS